MYGLNNYLSILSEFLPEGQTVNKEYYLSVMKRLREQIRRKRADL